VDEVKKGSLQLTNPFLKIDVSFSRPYPWYRTWG